AGGDMSRDEYARPAWIEEPGIAHHIAPGWPYFGKNRADVGSIVWRTRLTREAVVHGIEMVADIAHVLHRADDGKMLTQIGQPRSQFANLHSGHPRGDGPIGASNVLGSIRLQIPHVEMAWPAAKPKE